MLFVTAVLNYTGETATRIVKKIKDGNIHLKEKLIKDYIPFILGIVSNFYTSGAMELKNSDEFSIGLMAFDEAIDKFDFNKGRSFLKFAELVIRSRMMDYYRKISSVNKREIPFSYFGSKSETEIQKKLSSSNIESESGRYEFICELRDFTEKLKGFGLNIEKLPDYMPKHKDSRQMCMDIAKKIVENKGIFDKLKTKKYIQMKELSKIINVHPRTVERNRAFIICLCIIQSNDYENFKNYLDMVF